MVTHFDSIWRGLWEHGLLREREPGTRAAGGALIADDTRDDEGDDDEIHWVQGNRTSIGSARALHLVGVPGVSLCIVNLISQATST